jgi:hypothetical protein
LENRKTAIFCGPSAGNEIFINHSELREIYESRQKWEMDKNSLVDDAFHKGEEKGKLEGKLE